MFETRRNTPLVEFKKSTAKNSTRTKNLNMKQNKNLNNNSAVLKMLNFRENKIMPIFALVANENVSAFLIITKAFASFIKMFLGLLFVRVLLQWFVHFDWDSQPWMMIRQVTDPYINIFRGIIPPLMGTMDLTPLIGFYLLQILVNILMAPFSNSPDLW